MQASDLWKNFRLGEEIHVAGSFIYNGLRRFHELRSLNNSDELFEFLYSLSVGFERLLKIAVVLHEHSELINQTDLEKSLITHNHLDLLNRLKKHGPIDLSKPHNELLQLLSTFYKSLRYDRFSLQSAYNGEREFTAIKAILAKHLKITFDADSSLFSTRNEERYRAFIRRTVLKISRTIFESVKNRSRYLNIHTYELRDGSKAQSVFLREVDIADEDVLWKELLIFFMAAQPNTSYLKFIKGIEPLDFDPALVPDYLNCFKSDASTAEVMDELEHHYSEMASDTRKKRLSMIGVIGAPDTYFPEPEDD